MQDLGVLNSMDWRECREKGYVVGCMGTRNERDVCGDENRSGERLGVEWEG